MTDAGGVQIVNATPMFAAVLSGSVPEPTARTAGQTWREWLVATPAFSALARILELSLPTEVTRILSPDCHAALGHEAAPCGEWRLGEIEGEQIRFAINIDGTRAAYVRFRLAKRPSLRSRQGRSEEDRLLGEDFTSKYDNND